PATMQPRSSTTVSTNLSLLINIAFITPSVRAVTWTEIVPAVAAFPTAYRVATLIVDTTTDFGTPADATRSPRTPASPIPDRQPHARQGAAALREPLRQPRSGP